MGHLKDITNQPKIQTFPGATFQIQGQVPAAQCSEAKIEGDDAETEGPPFLGLVHFQKFIGYNLVGKICHITASVGGNTGDFDITSNDEHILHFVQDPGDGYPVEYYISNGSELILTRDIQSFAQFIHAAGYSHTIKGGKLYTNIPSNLLQPACSILFDPLT